MRSGEGKDMLKVGVDRSLYLITVAGCFCGRLQRLVWRWNLEMEGVSEPARKLFAPVGYYHM